jgi:hypothetical protein
VEAKTIVGRYAQPRPTSTHSCAERLRTARDNLLAIDPIFAPTSGWFSTRISTKGAARQWTLLPPSFWALGLLENDLASIGLGDIARAVEEQKPIRNAGKQ